MSRDCLHITGIRAYQGEVSRGWGAGTPCAGLVLLLLLPPVSGIDFSFSFGSLQLFGAGLAQNSFYKCTRWLVKASPALFSIPHTPPQYIHQPPTNRSSSPLLSQGKASGREGQKVSVPQSHHPTPHPREPGLAPQLVGPPFCQPWGTPNPPYLLVTFSSLTEVQYLACLWTYSHSKPHQNLLHLSTANLGPLGSTAGAEPIVGGQ